MGFDAEKAMRAIDKRIDRLVADFNKVNQRTYAEVVKLQKEVKANKDRETKNLSDQNRVNQLAHDEVAKLEKRLRKIE